MTERRDVVDALASAVDEVARQLVQDVPVEEVLDERVDLEWSFDGPGKWYIYVEGVRGALEDGHVTVTIFATARRLLRRSVECSRTVRCPLTPA